MSWLLNEFESEFRMFGGREFQRVGAAMAKALSPRVRCFELVRRLVLDDLSGGVTFKEVGKVGGGGQGY